MDHTIIHFEIPSGNPEKLIEFYKKLFGWKITKAEGSMEYWLVETAPEGKGVNGGIMKKLMPQQMPMNYISVESVDEYSRKIVKLGGKILSPRRVVPFMGYFAIAVDIDSNVFGIWQNDPDAK